MVQVTNAPEGRTYISYSWEENEQAKQCRDRFFVPRWPEDYVLVETPHVVPNGKWIVDDRPGWGPSWLVSAEWDEIEQISLTGKSGQPYDTRTLYICDKPFGFVARHDDLDYSDTPKSELRKTLVYARQIYKGELGLSVSIPRLKYVRANDKRRGNGWVRLKDLVQATGLSVEDVVLGFWQYSGHHNYRSYNNDQQGGQLLDIVDATSEYEIVHKQPMLYSPTKAGMVNFFEEIYLDRIYVRRGFAYTVLRLLALGVRPEVAQLV